MGSFYRVERFGGWSLVAVVAALLHALPASAENEVLCDASQPSMNELPILDKHCPIGEGVWGKQIPMSPTSLYWIQCGILEKPMPLKQAKKLYSQITTDIWMLPQSRSYRCLIGPYEDATLAQQELTQVKSLSGYHDAFIRHVEPDTSSSAPKAKPAKLSASASVKADALTTPKVMSNQKATTIQPLAQSAPAPITVRLTTQVKGKRYIIPYIANNDHQFYMEHDKAWNRLNYRTAIKVCSDMDMHLASNDDWQTLVASGKMQTERWPLQMPYWGDGQKGLFTNGKVSPLKGNTLLNVVCVGR